MYRTVFLILVLCQPSLAQSVDGQLREVRTEMQRLRQEVDELKRQLQTRADVAEEVPVLQAQIQEQAQTKVETTTKFPMKVFGTIVSNTFWNSGEPNWLDIPNIAGPNIPGTRPGSFSSSLRQTRIGANPEGPDIAGMKLNGTVAMDLFGGIPNFQTGQVMGLPRLLYGYVRLDGEKTAFEIGQDQMVLAPKNPTSLMGSAFPTLYRSGNLYLRAPQLRAERTLASGDFGEIRAVGGIMAPIAGDFGGLYQFVPPNLAGERSRMPAIQSRLSWRAAPVGPYEQPQWEFGFSGHYGREQYAAGVTPSWATARGFRRQCGTSRARRGIFRGKKY